MNNELPTILNDFLLELEQSYGKLPAAIMDSFILTACKCYLSVENANGKLSFFEEFLEEQYSSLSNVFSTPNNEDFSTLHNSVLALRPKKRCW
jgi:hypothetical protein